MNITEIRRTFLLVAIVTISYFLWIKWGEFSTAHAPAQTAISTNASTKAGTAPQQPIPGQEDVPQLASSASEKIVPAVLEESQSAAQHLITIETDALRLKVDLHGGNVVQAQLLKYADSKEKPKTPFTLLTDVQTDLNQAQSGLRSQMGPDTQHGQAQFTSDKTEYVLQPGQDKLVVPLKWRSPEGVEVTKLLTLERDKYLIDFKYELHNQSNQTWQGQLFTQLKRVKPEKKSGGTFQISAYTGAAISTADKRFEKVKFEQLADKGLDRQDVENGWVAMIQHYFLTAWVPQQNIPQRFYGSRGSDGYYRIGALGATQSVAPGASANFDSKLYLGPEITTDLKAVAPGLELTVDYGWFWPISQCIFWVMKQLYQVLGNWGWSIIGVTLLIKMLFYGLSARSYRSMAHMRQVQPKIEALKERYGDDKQGMTQALMEMYRKEKINPMGGCLPILVQIPVFIALYWVLIESVELRHAPFLAWITDLSSKDPYYLLPVLMGASMFLQQRLNPAPPDPVQARVMMAMPFVFTLLFMSFPAGLMLYWVTNNMLSMLQQWAITRSMEKSNANAKPKLGARAGLSKK